MKETLGSRGEDFQKRQLKVNGISASKKRKFLEMFVFLLPLLPALKKNSPRCSKPLQQSWMTQFVGAQCVPIWPPELSGYLEKLGLDTSSSAILQYQNLDYNMEALVSDYQ